MQPEDPRVKYAWLMELEGLWVGLTHYVPVPERPPNFTMAHWVERFFPERKPDVIVSGDTHREAIAWVDERIDQGKKVLVHCRFGVGRTGTFVTAYLLKYGLNMKGAAKLLKATRANPSNYCQWKLLRQYQKKLKKA